MHKRTLCLLVMGVATSTLSELSFGKHAEESIAESIPASAPLLESARTRTFTIVKTPITQWPLTIRPPHESSTCTTAVLPPEEKVKAPDSEYDPTLRSQYDAVINGQRHGIPAAVALSYVGDNLKTKLSYVGDNFKTKFLCEKAIQSHPVFATCEPMRKGRIHIMIV